MEISAAQAYRARKVDRKINEKFIVGAAKASPEYTLDALFCVARDGNG